MIREAIGIGETEELAKADALQQLGLTNSDGVEFEIIKRAEKKKFGIFGGSPAKVKAVYDVSDEEMNNETVNNEIVEEKEETDSESVEVSVKAYENIVNDENQDNITANDGYSPAQGAKEYVENILKAMGLEDIEVTITEGDNSAEINLAGEQVGAVIGRRGETLDALQYLAGLVANHVGNSYYRITINIGDYREKREKTLEILGRKLAFKVLKTGKNVSLEPMNPYERRIIHTSVQKVNGAISWSEGEVINRHVVIGLDPEYKRTYRKNNYNNRGGRKNYNGGYDKKRNYNSNQKKTDSSDAVKIEREPKNEGGNFSLYGKIDTKK
ncbi:MAG: RNA-binding cell elongation regulator Jag/EloR [Acutalibacteraceae bacterium]|nr:RNA-binding cell elongation regulator Jag/EloR [Acutalibacteraceae bacterium]